MMRLILLYIAACLIGLLPGLVSAADEPKAGKVMVILDASGSMWGRVDGQPKIEIARQVLDELLAGWDEDLEMGVMAYGHRRKGDCEDIETLVPVGEVDPPAIGRAVADLNPKGKTPLSTAVRRAAEALKHTEERASVILISDGRETCDADPCAVGAELEKTGVDFTAHVIGFDVAGPEQAGLRCLAENTGGEFFAAGQADELRAALDRAAERVQKAQAGVTLKAVDRPNGPALHDEALRWTVVPAQGDQPVVEDKAVATPRLELEPGRYTARVSLGAASAERSFQVGPDRRAVHELVLKLDAAVQAPEQVAAGAGFEVSWEGPDKKDDYVTVVPAEAPEGEYGDYAYTRNGEPLTLRAPDQPGAYEVRYLSGQSNTTLASAPIEVQPTDAAVEVPAQVKAGSNFQVDWQGPDNKGDYVTVVPADAPEGEYAGYAHTSTGNPLNLRAPDDPGGYEVRYVTGQANRTLARASMKVLATEAALKAPERVDAGSNIKVHWQGPDNKGDYITIVEKNASEGDYGNYAETGAGNPVDLRAPDRAGAYELRYMTGQHNKTLARAPITVEAVEASLDAPTSAEAGSMIRVNWQGPDNDQDYITVVEANAPEGEYGHYSYTDSGNPLNLRLPDAPGEYELRYLTGQTNKTVARQTITVKAASATLEAPGTVKAGTDFQVTWEGPDNQGDYITLVTQDTPDGDYGLYHETSAGSPMTFTAPKSAGAYELRYQTGQSNRVIARRPITVEGDSGE